MSSERQCVFCGATDGLPREHLLADWLAQVFPESAAESVMHFRQIGKDRSERREWLRKPFRERARVACGTWQQRLDERPGDGRQPDVGTAHSASALLARSRGSISRRGVGFKTCLVLQASQADDPMAPRSHFESLRRRSAPPRHQVTVWISSNYRGREGQLDFAFMQRPLAMNSSDERLADEDEFGYLNFLTVGALAFLVTGHRFANRTEVEYTGSLSEALSKIWPDASGLVPWPPEYMMDSDFIDTLTLEGVGRFETRIWPGAPRLGGRGRGL